MDTERDIIREIPKGLLKWYDFERDSNVLYIGDEGEALAEMLQGLPLRTDCVPLLQTMEGGWQESHAEGYDYIICILYLEKHREPERILAAWRKLLRKGGRLLLGMNNRFGLRYFCGDRDPHTGRNYDGIEDYRRACAGEGESFSGRCYSRGELSRMLKEAGWPHEKAYTVMPDLTHPQLIYAQDCLPNEELSSRFYPMYNYPPTVFLEEECLYTGLAESGMFHAMANAYLIECPADGRFSDVSHVTLALERGQEEACMTVIHGDRVVEKHAFFPAGEGRLRKMADHVEDLRAHGIHVVDAKMEGSVLKMPYIRAQTAQVRLKWLLQHDKDRFILEMDRFRDLILQSSDIVSEDKGDGKGAVLKRGYLDLVPLNCFYADDTYIFYDQEFCMEDCPANVIIMRMIATLYFGNVEMEALLPNSFFMERYGLLAEMALWMRTEWEFIYGLRKEKELAQYHERNWRNFGLVNQNRRRMNFSAPDYQRLFVDIFRNADTRKLILFGSGNYAREFLALYRHEYPIFAVIDNDPSKWGQEMGNTRIQSPELLRSLQIGEYKVLICAKDYYGMMEQMESMGVREYSVFDPAGNYPRERKAVPSGKSEPDRAGTQPKKFHVGYVAGVFDLFHIGHLNLLRRAREQCDHLIAGVVTDERTERIKGERPFIPFEERLELVRSCRYVDEAVEIPTDHGDTRDAWQLYHFDCQFSGNDHMDDPHWKAEKEFLEQNGAELVYFPYTEGTSSTKIRALIEKELTGR